MVSFQFKYFSAAILLVSAEVLIALFAHDRLIRPYGGDVLVVILIYCVIKTFVWWPVLRTALTSLLFAYLVETLQFFNWLDYLGLADSKSANVILGNSFSWLDILAYTLGTIIVISVEYYLFSQNRLRKTMEPMFI